MPLPFMDYWTIISSICTDYIDLPHGKKLKTLRRHPSDSIDVMLQHIQSLLTTIACNAPAGEIVSLFVIDALPAHCGSSEITSLRKANFSIGHKLHCRTWGPHSWTICMDYIDLHPLPGVICEKYLITCIYVSLYKYKIITLLYIRFTDKL